ncbi:porin [Caballeronia sp. J97]|uniref:porin n=1 Tax=Caballeronia sp. J97 TaxID=2805429 RepID=UPI002AB1DB60|nr:porin [Caballeronia sp. J97]
MKKILTLSSLMLAMPCAYAQSSVTLYGILDEGLTFVNNVGGPTGGKRFALDSTSGISGSRWGFTGKEDLGGGLKAIFTLEGGINLNNGQSAQGGTFLGRQAFVGLSSSQLGSLTLGRQYDMITYFLQPFTSGGSQQAGSVLFLHPGDIDNTGNSLRVNNAIRYMSASYAGLTFGGEYSVGGQPGNVTGNSGYSLGATYANGPLSLGAGFAYFKNPTSATPGSGLFTNNANGASFLANSLNRGYSSASSWQVVGAGAGYTIGGLTVTGAWTNIQFAGLGGTFGGAMARFNNYDVTARYQATPALSFAAAYDYLNGAGVTQTNGQTVGNQHYNQVALLGDYLLSKRTDVYVEGTYQRASGTSSTGAAAVADIGNIGDSTNNHQFAARIALRHRF